MLSNPYYLYESIAERLEDYLDKKLTVGTKISFEEIKDKINEFDEYLDLNQLSKIKCRNYILYIFSIYSEQSGNEIEIDKESQTLKIYLNEK